MLAIKRCLVSITVFLSTEHHLFGLDFSTITKLTILLTEQKTIILTKHLLDLI